MTETNKMSLRDNPQPQVHSGFYLASIIDMDSTVSSYGTPMARFRFRLVRGKSDQSQHTYLWRVPMTAEDIHKLSQVNRALGLPTPSLPRLRSGEDKLDTEVYLGSNVLVYLKAEWYQGKRRSIITEIRSMDQAVMYRAILKGESEVEADAEAAGL